MIVRAAADSVRDDIRISEYEQAYKIQGMSIKSTITPSVLADLKKGSYDAYTLLYMRYASSVKSFLTSMLRSEEDAKELTQNVFIRLWEKRESIDPESDIKVFLFQTARFYAYNFFDHLKVKEKYSTWLKQEKGNDYFSTEDVVNYEETALLFEFALDKMPEQRRKVFEMSRKGGKSNDEIAEELSLSKRTVEKHISLAIKDVRAVLD